MLKLYNSLSQEKEIFQALQAREVKIYVCGMTVYDYCHLGHMRMLMAFDLVVRYLRFLQYKVCYVRNITDIDDKIIKRANENKEDYRELTARFIQAMQEDIEALNLLPPDKEPRATAFIPEMLALIKQLIQKDYAYQAENGDVFFNVRRFPRYGCLSHRNIDELESGARIEINEVKKDPLDFVLWKMAKPGEPAWDSPWGLGRPGWHIECSAMAMNLLGEQFDIHGGGRDLIFPHHENEIAQSEAASGKPFVKTWMHNGYVQINKEKMSKSLGNFLTIRELLAQYPAEAVRYFLIASQYRSPLQFSETAIPQAYQALERFYIALRGQASTKALENSSYEARFIEAMNDDLNTPLALAVLFELAHEIHRLREKDKNQAAAHAGLLRKLGGVLGILQQEPEAFLKTALRVDEAVVEQLIHARNEARAQKNWTEADRLRQELAALSIVLEDGPEGTTWRYELR
ncbi:MAG TPA: cysteine--tRNA ligase [Gammaproteobacteria bacterium]|nr:cysteine--tRNA ligase [Gammaproteobacteria bacterium]